VTGAATRERRYEKHHLAPVANLTGLDALAVTDPGAAARLRTRYEAARRVLLVAVIG
jgi:hypothetical protein